MTAPPVPALSPPEVDEAVLAERRRLADALSHLTDDQWATASLCAAWSVRDVVAHLTTTTRTGPLRVLWAAVRARGSFDRMEMGLAAQRAAAHSTAGLVGLLRESAGSTRRDRPSLQVRAHLAIGSPTVLPLRVGRWLLRHARHAGGGPRPRLWTVTRPADLTARGRFAWRQPRIDVRGRPSQFCVFCPTVETGCRSDSRCYRGRHPVHLSAHPRSRSPDLGSLAPPGRRRRQRCS